MRPVKGYTAIEMLVVLTLVGVAATITLSNHMAQKPHHNLREASRDIISGLRHLRQKAITTGRTTVVDFYAGNDLYELDDLGEQALPSFVRFGYPAEVNQTPSGGLLSPGAADGVSFVGNSGSFEPNGTIKGIGGTVYLTNALSVPSGDYHYKEAVAISVNMTGRVKLYKWTGTTWE